MKYISDVNLFNLFKENKTVIEKMESVRKSLDIVFVFGASCNASTRGYFNRFIKKQSTKLDYITIETLTDDLKKYVLRKGIGREKIDLVELEREAIQYAYVVLIFPESPGSFAELGFFANDSFICKNIITVKNYSYCNDKTYLNYLIDFIHQNREIDSYTMKFIEKDDDKSAIEENDSKIFPKIVSSIEDSFESEHTDKENIYIPIKKILKEKEYKKLTIFLLYETIFLFQKLTYNELMVIYQHILKSFDIPFDKNAFKVQLSLLVASNYIQRENFNKTKTIFLIKKISINIRYTINRHTVKEASKMNDLWIKHYREMEI